MNVYAPGGNDKILLTQWSFARMMWFLMTSYLIKVVINNHIWYPGIFVK